MFLPGDIVEVMGDSKERTFVLKSSRFPVGFINPHPGIYFDNEFCWLEDENGHVDGWYEYNVKLIRKGPGMYVCGYCGEEGHNRRTCPAIKKDVAKEMKVIENKNEIEKGDVITVVGLEDSYNMYETNPDYSKYIGESYKVVDADGLQVRVEATTVSGRVMGTGTLNLRKDIWKFGFSETEEIKKRLSIWQLAEMVISEARLVLLYGPPGTGKTTAANFVPNSEGVIPQVWNITLTEETPAAELRGHFIPKGTEFIWMHGAAMMPFMKGGRLVLNEIDKASGDALTFCHALLDDPGIARITLPTGETIMPHEDFHVIATMNGHPDDLPEALRDRFAVKININKLHPGAVASLPEDLRKAASKGITTDGDRSVSVRGWKMFAHLREKIGEEEAALAVFGERAETILNTIKINRATAKKA